MSRTSIYFLIILAFIFIAFLHGRLWKWKQDNYWAEGLSNFELLKLWWKS